jgi:hypothetical protein
MTPVCKPGSFGIYQELFDLSTNTVKNGYYELTAKACFYRKCSFIKTTAGHSSHINCMNA